MGLLGFLARTYKTQPLFLVLDNFECVWNVGIRRPETEAVVAALITTHVLPLSLRDDAQNRASWRFAYHLCGKW
jgi:hypothetical protein